EEEHRHPDVAAAVDYVRVSHVSAEVVLEVDEDLPMQERERRNREARHLETTDLHLHKAVVAVHAPGGEPQLRLRGLACPTRRDRSVCKSAASSANGLKQLH